MRLGFAAAKGFHDIHDGAVVAVIGSGDGIVPGRHDQPRPEVDEGEDGASGQRVDRRQPGDAGATAVGRQHPALGRPRFLGRNQPKHHRHRRAETDDRDQDRHRVLPFLGRAEPRRRNQDHDRRGSGQCHHLRRWAGPGLPEQQGQRRHRRQRNSQYSCHQLPIHPRPPDQQGPAEQGSHRQRQRGDRGAPVVAIDRLRFAHIVQPQGLCFGRDAFEPLQAIRPGDDMKAGQQRAGRDRSAEP